MFVLTSKLKPNYGFQLFNIFCPENNLTSFFHFPIQPQASQHHTVIIEEFEPDVFRQLIEYIHTGCVMLQPRTLLGKSLRKKKTIFLNANLHKKD